MAERPAVDVAVVGGGAAGCVLAARLAASGTASVALIEAGPDPRADVPDGLRDGWHLGRPADWGYASEADEAGAVQPLRRGRLLGGTSWLTRFAMRGSPADYDAWEALGNPRWGFEHVLPSFRRLETDADLGDRPWHGNDGPIPVTRYLDLDRTEVHLATIGAAEAAGFARVHDHNEPGAVGVGPMPMNAIGGERVTTLTAYLADGRVPANLAIHPDSPVADIVFAGTRATGVRLVDGTVIEAGCVVLCAGTYGSPLILMRSGIGSADHLRSVGVAVRLDLAGVGANLGDHPGTDLECGYAGPARTVPLLHTAATFHSRGASTSGPPDLMLWLTDPDVPDDPPQLTIGVVLLKPRSRGEVRLRSADPADPPRIRLPDHRDPVDLDRLVEGFQRAIAVAEHPAVQRLGGHALPAGTRARDELVRLVGENAYSVPHVVGTCSMGPSPADGAVVDASGRVHGTERLYVADASIMPTVPSGFTHLPTIMIAERLSELIATAL